MASMETDSPGDPGAGLSGKMTRGAAWMIGLRFADRSIGFVSTIVLARLLVPEDFGLVALAMAMIAAIAVFGEFGFELALIQNQKADRKHYDTAWTMGILRGFLAAGIVALSATPFTGAFDDPRLTDVLLALALLPILEGFYNIGTVNFRKELQLNKEFIFRIVPRIAGVITTITIASLWRNYWALVVGTLAAASMRLVMSYVMQSYRPRISFRAFREIMHFSKWILVNSIATFANNRAHTFAIAKFLDAAALGAFALASEISAMASSELVAPIKKALFPGYAKIAHDAVQLRKAFLDAFGILALVTLPIAIGIALTADHFVPILLGPNWLTTIPLIQILAVSSAMAGLATQVRPIYLALNRPYFGAYAAIGRLIVFIPLLFWFLDRYGLLGAAYAHAVTQAAVLVGSLFIMHRLLRLRLIDIVRASGRPVIACACMAATILALKWNVLPSGPGIGAASAALVLEVLLGITVYSGTVLALWRLRRSPPNSAESYVLTFLLRAKRRQSSKLAGALPKNEP